MKMITIYCTDCYQPREIKPQDAFQVKRCVPCQKKHVAAQRRIKASNKRYRVAEDLAQLDMIINIFTTKGQISWESYCWVKFGEVLSHAGDAIRIWGKGECIAAAQHSYDEDDLAYWRSSGDTEAEIEDRIAERGGESLINNEFDNCGDINLGKDNRGMQYMFEDARKRISR